MLLGKVAPPSTHDEFSYLLQADTFLHGRLANPPHPMRKYFQTFHELMEPTYASKYPPAQGIALAIGTLLGHPIIGAFGTIALACGAIVWMLRACLPARWALFGGLLAAMHPLIYLWGQIYWGGGVAMLGGALVAGAAVRAVRRPRRIYGVVLGIGLGILANSRPFEGMIFGVGIVGWLVWRALSRKRLNEMLFHVMLTCVVTLMPIFVWMGYYNYRVTGSALQSPYMLYAQRFQLAPLLFWQKPSQMDLPDEIARYSAGYEFHEYQRQTSWPGYFAGVGEKVAAIAKQSFDPITLAILLLGLPLAIKRPAARWALAMLIGLPVLHMLITPWFRMQYLAPLGGFFVALLAFSSRSLSKWSIRKFRLGWTLIAIVLIVQAGNLAIFITKLCTNTRPLGAARADMMQELTQSPGRQLVIVRYLPGPQQIFEWVYNDADIDSSKVVFAHDKGPQTAAELRNYFRDRQFWLLEVQGSYYQLNRLSG